MKKCASCSKDLPEAALHCVFCGAKQPPTQAPQGLAKTVMGYSASEMIEQMKQQGQQGPTTRPGPAAAPPQPPPPAFSPPPPRPQPAPARPQPAPLPPTMAEPPRGNNAPTAYAGPGGFSPSGPAPLVPSAGSNAPTMYANHAPGPQPSYPAPAPMGSGPGPSMGGPMGGRSGPTPSVPMPHNVVPAPVGAPYLGSQTAARSGRPIEPWKDSLRFQMFVWGATLLAVFAVPIAIDPLLGYWNVVADGEGMMKLPPLVMASVGLLAIVIASVPMSPAPRGLIAGLLGVVGVVMPTILALVAGATPSWQSLVGLLVTLALIPGLLVRNEYRDSLLPRILVTVGVLAALLPQLVPNDAGVPLVNMFKVLIDADVKAMVLLLVGLVQIVIIVLCLLVWLPTPSTAMAKLFAWLLILWPLVAHVTALLLHADQIVDALKESPNLALFGPLMDQVDKHAAVMPAGWAVLAAYATITSYGLATVFGKQLE